MKKIKFLAVALLATLTLGLTSCNKDDEIAYDGETLSDGQFIEKEDFGTDNTAAYKLHFKFGYNQGNIEVIGLTSKGIPSTVSMMDCKTGVAIVDNGKCNGLSKIETIPGEESFKENGNFVTKVKAEAKHGYVIKVWGDHNLNVYQNPDIHDPEAAYIRLWVEDTEGNCKLRYEYPWVPAAN